MGGFFVQLVLHIGTHKTGTSALQLCLQRNGQILADNDIYYARMAPSTNCNGLASLIAKERGAEAKAFVDRHVDKANSLGAKTLIISAESFYAMTIFFHRLNGRQCHDYWRSESKAIQLLKDVLPQNVTARLVVFFRRQDQFLESIYRQLIMGRSVAMSINEFEFFMTEALDYWRHMEIWRSFFPSCAVYTYEEISGDTSEFFLRSVLNLTNVEKFDGLDSRVNIRWSRDVLEYKRILNRMDMSAVDKLMTNIACAQLARNLTDDGRHQEYLSPEARKALLRRTQIGNTLLSDTFGVDAFPTLLEEASQGWTPYPGLSTERARKLANRHKRIRRSAHYRIERWALRARELIQQRLPVLGWMIPLGRSLLPAHRHSVAAIMRRMGATPGSLDFGCGSRESENQRSGRQTPSA
jgi:hypothetical protein